MELKKITFKNEKNFIHCLNTQICYFDAEGLGQYSDQEVLDLIDDVELFFDYFTDVIDKRKFGLLEFVNDDAMNKFLKTIESDHFTILHLSSNIWSGIWNFHTDIVPEKHKEHLK